VRGLVAIAPLLILAVLSTPLAAQQVDVQLREEGSRAPIIGAIVRLLGEADDRVLTQGLSNEGGRISLRAPAAGRYRLKVDRIGWVGLVTPPFALAPGPPFQTEILLADIRMDLPTVEVQGQSVCGRQFDGDTEAANLWQEIQRALTATILSQREATTPLHMREFQRELLPNGRLAREWHTRSALVRGQVYRTLPPATLAAEGFVVYDHRSDSTMYAVPDAALLVSDAFTETHCFRTVSQRDGLVGLYFEPVPRRELPDIKGTIWLDASSYELRHLDYTYTGLPPLPQRVDLGGRVEFTRLPSGRWIVSHWWVRTPVLDQVERRGRVRIGGVQGGLLSARTSTMSYDRLIGFVEVGGRVVIAADAGPIVNQSIVTGRVTNPATGQGLEGAEVVVHGVPSPAVTNAEGHFTLSTPLHGERMATVRHPVFRLTSRPPDRPVLLSIGDTTVVDFSAPPMEQIVRAVCGNPRNRAGIIGVAVDATGATLPGVALQVTWRTATGQHRTERVRTTRDGAFGFCNLPTDLDLEFSRAGPDGPVLIRELELAPRQFEWVEVRVGG
jgi:hypothetical protein